MSKRKRRHLDRRADRGRRLRGRAAWGHPGPRRVRRQLPLRASYRRGLPVNAIARRLALLAVVAAGCSRSPKGLSVDGGASQTASPTANAAASVTATADASAEPDRSVDAAAPRPTAQRDPTGLPFRVVPLPSDDALVRSACLVEADCAAPSGLDASGYVYLESDAARSCEPSKTAECPALEHVSFPGVAHLDFGPLSLGGNENGPGESRRGCAAQTSSDRPPQAGRSTRALRKRNPEPSTLVHRLSPQRNAVRALVLRGRRTGLEEFARRRRVLVVSEARRDGSGDRGVHRLRRRPSLMVAGLALGPLERGWPVPEPARPRAAKRGEPMISRPHLRVSRAFAELPGAARPCREGVGP